MLNAVRGEAGESMSFHQIFFGGEVVNGIGHDFGQNSPNDLFFALRVDSVVQILNDTNQVLMLAVDLRQIDLRFGLSKLT